MFAILIGAAKLSTTESTSKMRLAIPPLPILSNLLLALITTVNKLVDCRIIEMCDPEHLSRINKIVDDKITALLINPNQTILYSDGKTPGENKQ